MCNHVLLILFTLAEFERKSKMAGPYVHVWKETASYVNTLCE